MNTIILALPGAERLAQSLAVHLHCTAATLEVHRFPDGEAVVRLPTSVAGQRTLLVAHLDRPDEKTLPLLFAADAARELGAGELGLVVPYLPYMRQDARFRPGEAITSRTYARLLSSTFDFLVTVDPHLHRWPSLDAIYSIRSVVVAAAPAMAVWIARNVERPILVGPDSESEQWVADVAKRIGAPWTVMRKERRGDRDVTVTPSQSIDPSGRNPVLLDDIVSSGHTIAAAAEVLRGAGWSQPLCVAVHALLDGEGADLLRRAGVSRVVSCDSVPHASNGIPLAPLLADGVRSLLPA
ncbi:ribose-phosphate pyrophosphokinase [Ramlibacter ginsenosidimutans]|uniref:Ribose-phosphate pyrophosphokinase n=1 Tax=Ramlibacter ginsenosidimutans TaxID=502333 RepID=A0A934TVE8_9BURK|nr:ribose-phosphate pyrophosphokinase [Ramlibacter ginsenosidimutans]MBK6007756.1 ribose-phosphate pyrophosphokinase [Ramlibacter ginsenosidimutans]